MKGAAAFIIAARFFERRIFTDNIENRYARFDYGKYIHVRRLGKVITIKQMADITNIPAATH